MHKSDGQLVSSMQKCGLGGWDQYLPYIVRIPMGQFFSDLCTFPLRSPLDILEYYLLTTDRYMTGPHYGS